MRKASQVLLFAWVLSQGVWAQLPVYRSLPSSDCRTVVVGTRTVIQDARGFFLGYLVPLPPAFTPAPKRLPTRVHSSSSWYSGDGWQNYDGCPADVSDGPDCPGGSSSSTGSSYSDPGGSPLCSPDYGFGR